MNETNKMSSDGGSSFPRDLIRSHFLRRKINKAKDIDNMIDILGIADEVSLKKKELSVLSVLGLRGKHRKVFSRCRKFHYQMRRKLVGTDFKGLKRVFRISDNESVVSTPRSMDTPRSSFSSEGTLRDTSSVDKSSSHVKMDDKSKPLRQDSYTIEDQTLVIEDCGYAFSLPPGFILEDEEEDFDEKTDEPLKRLLSNQILKNGVDTLECCLDFLGPEEILQISVSCRSLFYLSESYWPSSRGLYCERVKKIRICRQNFDAAQEDINRVLKQIKVWETQQGAHVEKRLITLRKNLGAKEQERDFKAKEFQRAMSLLSNHRDLHSKFYFYGGRPNSVESLESRASSGNSILKVNSGRLVSTSSGCVADSKLVSRTPTASSSKNRESTPSIVRSPVLSFVKSLPHGSMKKKQLVEPKLSLSRSGPGSRVFSGD